MLAECCSNIEALSPVAESGLDFVFSDREFGVILKILRAFLLMESSSSSASFKRARAPGSGNHVPSCLVDGCTADLSKCRDYHRRHKVCEVHSKTPKVTIRGQEQRFCQQCSRFHSLVEFDEGKRSCRKRLDGHNRRRRKPQPDPLSLNSGRFLSNHQGTRYLSFGSPHIFSPTTITSSWMGAVKVETDINSLNFSTRNSFFPGSSSHNYNGGKEFSFLQTTSSSLPGVSVCQPLLDANPSSSNGGSSSSSRKMFSNGLNQAIDSNRALSLLSSQPAETREIGLSPVVQSGPGSSLIPNMQYNDLGMEGAQLGTILASDDCSNNTNLHGHEMFRTGHPRSSASGTHHTLSFSWE